MADDNLFSISKLRSILNKLLSGFSRILEGFEVTDSDIEEKQGQVSFEAKFKPKDLDTEMIVNLTAANIGQAFRDITNVINTLSLNSLAYPNDRKAVDLLTNALTSKRVYLDEKTGEYVGDITVHAGEGLLGVDLEKAESLTDAVFDSWYPFAYEKLNYNLSCEAAGYQQGQVSNTDLLSCGKWVLKYVDYIKENNTDNQQLSSSEKQRRQDIAYAISFNLVKPILINIQGQLNKLYQDRLNDDTTLDKLIPGQHSEESSENNEGTAETNQNNQNAQNAQDVQNTGAEDTNGGSPMDANSSKHITVKLQKVEGSDDINLLGLQSNYAPAATLDDIDDIINQAEFCDALTDAPQVFAIDVDDDGYDIEPCENCEISCGESLGNILKSAIAFYRNLFILHWMAKGNDMMKLHELSQEMYEELIEEIDTLGELMVEKCGTVISPSFGCEYLEIKNYEFQEGLDIIVKYIEDYLTIIDYAYSNQSSDVQSVLDEYIRYWNKQKNYFVARQEE